DVARALVAMGQAHPARNAVKHGLRLLGPGGDGLRLELLVTMQEASPDPRVVDAIRLVVARMMPALPPPHEQAFRRRPFVGQALADPPSPPDPSER
ncbi:MAG: hypothetical protein KC621_09625, partial [Myxococcales bacterium]|nr:hypothetical protein [Myxococcales bacterium]